MAKKAAVNVGQASRLSQKSEKHETGAKSGVASSLRLEKSARSADTTPRQKPSSLLDTRVIYCGDNLEQLAKLPDASLDLIYIDQPFNSNRNYEVFWGETKEKRAFEDRHESRGIGGRVEKSGLNFGSARFLLEAYVPIFQLRLGIKPGQDDGIVSCRHILREEDCESVSGAWWRVGNGDCCSTTTGIAIFSKI